MAKRLALSGMPVFADSPRAIRLRERRTPRVSRSRWKPGGGTREARSFQLGIVCRDIASGLMRSAWTELCRSSRADPIVRSVLHERGIHHTREVDTAHASIVCREHRLCINELLGTRKW